MKSQSSQCSEEGRWTQHPVISTVLWILGDGGATASAAVPQATSTSSGLTSSSSASASTASASASTASSRERVVWKDELHQSHPSSSSASSSSQGGTLNEYFALQGSPQAPRRTALSNASSSSSSASASASAPSASISNTNNNTSIRVSSVDREVDIRTLQNTLNNTHHNIYQSQTPAAASVPASAQSQEEGEGYTLNPTVLGGGRPVVHPGSVDSNQSPNWGFYVAITPTQEVYAASHPYSHQQPPYAR